MNPVLERILISGTVSARGRTYPVDHHLSADEGGLLQRTIATVRPRVTLEIGVAYGISTLYICEALAALGTASRHHAIDPNETSHYHRIALEQVRAAGYDSMVELHEEPSEIALPRLLASGMRIDVALIDGWHTFDHTLVDFFYVNKMLNVGGVVLIDDVGLPSVHRAVAHISTYPAYELMATTPPELTRPRQRIRRWLARTPIGRMLHPAILTRPSDRGWGSFVAFRKVADDVRPWNWWRDF